MSKIIKKFNQYIKENIDKGLEDDDFPIEGSDLDAIEEMESDLEDDDFEDDFEDLDDSEDDDTEIREYEEEEEEEEAHQYIGSQLMNELAEKLGVEVINNEIQYDGKKINYFSETECFHVDNKKFETIEDILEYLSDSDDSDEEE